MAHEWTEQQKQWLRDNRRGFFGMAFVTAAFNQAFGLALSRSQVDGACQRYGAKTGRHGWEAPDGGARIRPCPKGGRMSPATEFKKGHLPHSYRPVGSMRVNVDGYQEIKTADPRTWRYYHCVFWEALHGPIPQGHVLIFLDGNKLAVTDDNLVCISRNALARLNQQGFAKLPPDRALRRAYVRVVQLEAQARARAAA